MTLRDSVLKWNGSWRYDYWWREKHNIAFNSEAHRAANQIDIKFEYTEQVLAHQEYDKLRQDQHKAKKLKETGQWLQQRSNKAYEDKLFEKVNFKDFNN